MTRVLSSHYPTSLLPESLNKRIVSDDSLSKIEECVKRTNNTENTGSVYEWNRLPVDRMQHMQPANQNEDRNRKQKL